MSVEYWLWYLYKKSTIPLGVRFTVNHNNLPKKKIKGSHMDH
jgi:hypothetical protein